MFETRDSIQQRWRFIVLLSIFFLVAIIVQDLIREVIVFNQDVNVIEDELYRDIQDDVKDLVNNVDNEIMYILSNLDDSAEDHAEQNLSDLLFSASMLMELHDGVDQAELINDIIYITEQYDADQNHVYSIFTIDGIELYDGFSDSRTNLDRSDDLDYLGRPYMANFLQDVASGDAVQEMYLLEDDVIEEYKLYGVYLEDLDIVLVSSVKVSHYSNVLRSNLIDQLGDLNATLTNTVYLISDDGELLYHQNEAAIGLTVDDETYPVWQNTIQIIMDYAETEEEGFLEYQFYSNYSNGVLKTKVAYIKHIDEWDIIIGASSDNDIYDSIIDSYRADNARTVLLVKVPAYVVILTLAVLIIIFVQHNVGMVQALLEEEKRLYQIFADVSSEILIICNKQGKIVFTNAKARHIIFGDREWTEDMFFDQIMVEEEGYYILYGLKEERFVKYSVETVDYLQKPSDLYIVIDVTDTVRNERQLEDLSMRDELTSLYNRRMMVKDYKDVILPHAKQGGKAVMVMIDLDNFKPANDKFGHSFGDQVLQDIARIFLSHASKDVRVYRVGGDEFAMFLRDMDQPIIHALLETIQEEIQSYPYGKDVDVSFSAGVIKIELADKRRRFSDFYEAADQLLYESKKEGKGRIQF